MLDADSFEGGLPMTARMLDSFELDDVLGLLPSFSFITQAE